MKYLIFLIALTAAAQYDPVDPIWQTKRGLVRSGLVGGWDLRGGSGQTVANLVAGGAALQLGSTAGVDTNDPTRGATGLVFDGVDDRAVSTGANPTSTLTMIAVAKTASMATQIFVGGTGNGGPTLKVVSGAVQFSSQNIADCPSSTITGLNNGAWFSVSATLGAGAVAYYKNGAISSSAACNVVASATTTRLGDGPFGSAAVNGEMGIVLIYNRVLSPAEVKRNHVWLRAQMAQVGVTLP